MPVDKWDRSSISPELRGRSITPEQVDDKQVKAGPSTKPKYEPHDVVRHKIEKLFADPSKEVQLPSGPKERQLRAPREMMKNVQGSSSGAGSGEFHVYKQSRRREYERLKMMEDKNRALEEQAAFLARQAERDAAADAKTAKNRAKRNKRKAGKKGGGGAGGERGSALGGGGDGGAGPSKLRKLEPSGAASAGGPILFKRPAADGAEDSDDDDDAGDEGVNGEVGPSVDVMEKAREENGMAAAAPLSTVAEGQILIHDDD